MDNGRARRRPFAFPSTMRWATTTSCSIPRVGPSRRTRRRSCGCATGTRGSARTACCGDRLVGDPFGIRLFNPDGSEFEKSGNGLRIFARYCGTSDCRGAGIIEILTTVGAGDRAHPGRAGKPHCDGYRASGSSRPRAVGLVTDERELVEAQVQVAGTRVTITAVRVGNPHCVVLRGGRGAAARLRPVDAAGPKLGPEVETANALSQAHERAVRPGDRTAQVEIAIWERGAGYTLASGTSSCAAAAAAIRAGRCESPVTVRMPGGEMLVEIDEDWNVRLTGTVERVCSGRSRRLNRRQPAAATCRRQPLKS